MAHSEKLEETALWKEVVHIKIKNDIKLSKLKVAVKYRF